jgi:cytochrome c-type biogenesis protein CcmH/NrfG
MFVFSSPGGTKSQQQAKGLSPAGKARQQQQAHRSEPLTAAAVRATIARQIEDFRELGNNLQMAGDMDGAEAAYMEALDLQPNHVKVCGAYPGKGSSSRCCCLGPQGWA